MLLNVVRKFQQQLVILVIPPKKKGHCFHIGLITGDLLYCFQSRNNMNLTKLLFLVAWATVFLFFSGCSEKVGYQPGVVTHSVLGTINKATDQNHQSDTFVLVKEHVRTFMSTSEGDLHRISAKIIKADKTGNYVVAYDSNVSQVDLYYISEGHFMDSETFRKTLFIGAYEYSPSLKVDADFKNSYYLVIKPLLTELITEPRYQLPISDQIFIEEWLNQMDMTY